MLKPFTAESPLPPQEPGWEEQLGFDYRELDAMWLSRWTTDGGWEQGRLYELTIRLVRPLWGYRLTYTESQTGRAELLLELRPPPAVDPAAPLRGRRIAVDAGHPPVGAFGPTGFFEGDANLAIALRLAVLLAEAGAEPLLTRRDTLPLGLRTKNSEGSGS